MFNFLTSTFQEGEEKKEKWHTTKSTIYDTTRVNRTSLDTKENERLNSARNLYYVIFLQYGHTWRQDSMC